MILILALYVEVWFLSMQGYPQGYPQQGGYPPQQQPPQQGYYPQQPGYPPQGAPQQMNRY